MRRCLVTTQEVAHREGTIMMGALTFSLRRSLKSCVSSSRDFLALGGFGGTGTLAFLG
jgi:hypothetical protein